MLGCWDGSMASPRLLLLCLWNSPRRGMWVTPQSRPHPSLFFLFIPLLDFTLSSGFNHCQHLLHPAFCRWRQWPTESLSYIPKLERWKRWSREARGACGQIGPSEDLVWGWASLALILRPKFNVLGHCTLSFFCGKMRRNSYMNYTCLYPTEPAQVGCHSNTWSPSAGPWEKAEFLVPDKAWFILSF